MKHLLFIPWIALFWGCIHSDRLTGEDAMGNSMFCLLMFLLAVVCTGVWFTIGSKKT